MRRSRAPECDDARVDGRRSRWPIRGLLGGYRRRWRGLPRAVPARSSSARAPNGCARTGIGQELLRRERDLVFAVRAMELDFLAPARLDDALLRAPCALRECRARQPARSRSSHRARRSDDAVAACAASTRADARLPDGAAQTLSGPRRDHPSTTLIPADALPMRGLPPSRPAEDVARRCRARSRRCRPRLLSWSCTPACRCKLVMAAAAGRLGRVVGDHLPQEARCSTAPRAKPTRFEERFWSGADLAKLYSGRHRARRAASAAWRRSSKPASASSPPAPAQAASTARMQLEGAQRAMRATLSREVDGSSTTSSSSPTSARPARTSACSARCGAS